MEVNKYNEDKKITDSGYYMRAISSLFDSVIGLIISMTNSLKRFVSLFNFDITTIGTVVIKIMIISKIIVLPPFSLFLTKVLIESARDLNEFTSDVIKIVTDVMMEFRNEIGKYNHNQDQLNALKDEIKLLKEEKNSDIAKITTLLDENKRLEIEKSRSQASNEIYREQKLGNGTSTFLHTINLMIVLGRFASSAYSWYNGDVEPKLTQDHLDKIVKTDENANAIRSAISIPSTTKPMYSGNLGKIQDTYIPRGS